MEGILLANEHMCTMVVSCDPFFIAGPFLFPPPSLSFAATLFCDGLIEIEIKLFSSTIGNYKI